MNSLRRALLTTARSILRTKADAIGNRLQIQIGHLFQHVEQTAGWNQIASTHPARTLSHLIKPYSLAAFSHDAGKMRESGVATVGPFGAFGMGAAQRRTVEDVLHAIPTSLGSAVFGCQDEGTGIRFVDYLNSIGITLPHQQKKIIDNTDIRLARAILRVAPDNLPGMANYIQSFARPFFSEEHRVSINPSEVENLGDGHTLTQMNKSGGEAPTHVYRVTLDEEEEKYYFRPFDSSQMETAQGVDRGETVATNLHLSFPNRAARTMMGAWLIDERVGADTTVHSRIVSINGILGVLSESASGDQVTKLAELYDADYNQFIRFMTMQYLFGNTDISIGHNMFLNARDNAISIDFDQAFAICMQLMGHPGTTNRRNHLRTFGGTLPPDFDHELMEQIEAQLDREQLEVLVGRFFEPDEINAILIRRALLLSEWKAL